jgi:hypothetical protein
VRLKRWAILFGIAAAFIAGTKTGIEYAKSRYVSRDRKFIEGKVVGKNEN